MISAAVGFQCPECVAKAQAASRNPLTPMGGEIISRPTVTWVLIGLNVAAFIVTWAAGLDASINAFGMSPGAVSIGGEAWRLITSAFIHGALWHIGFNMLVLYFIGPQLEALFGHVRYLLVFVVSALGGSIAAYLLSPFNAVTIGASGAIFGLMAALVVAGRSLKHDVTQVLILLVVNFLIGLVLAGVSWQGHLGGALTGAAVAAVFAYAPKQSRVLWQTLGVLAILAVLVVAMMVRTAQIQAQFTVPSGAAVRSADVGPTNDIPVITRL